MLQSKGLNINKKYYQWFVNARSKNIPITRSLVKAKAKEIAEQLDYTSFNASDGWLQKETISGESADVNEENVSQFKDKLPSMLLGYKSEDVYNADESSSVHSRIKR